MLMLVLGVNDAIEINVFPPSVNASFNASVNANARCEYTRNIVDTSGCVNIFSCDKKCASYFT